MTGRITLMDGDGHTWFQPDARIDSWSCVEFPGLTRQRRADLELFWRPVVEVVEPASALTPKEEQ